MGDTLSVVFATGGIASAIATSGIFSSRYINDLSNHSRLDETQNLELKIQNCTHAYHSYQHLLIAIKDMMRGGDFQPNILHTMMNNIVIM